MKFSFPAQFEALKKIDKQALKHLLLGTKPAYSGPVTHLACDFGRSKIVFLEISRQDTTVVLQKFQKVSRTGDKAKDLEALKQAFAEGGYASNRIRVSVKGQGVILRFVQFPQMKHEELRSAISYEIEQYIPFKAAEVIWDFQILDEDVPLASGKGMNVLLVAAKKEDLYNMVSFFQSAALEIEIVDVDALAAMNAMEFFHPEQMQAPTALLDIGSEISTLSIVLGGKPRFIRDVSYGGLDMIKKLKRKVGLTQEQAMQQIEVDRVPTPEAQVALKEALGELVSELKLSLSYYLDQVPSAEPVKTLFISGGGGYHPLVVETLTSELGIKVETMDILNKIQLAPGMDAEVIRKNQGLFPVSLGLCLR